MMDHSVEGLVQEGESLADKMSAYFKTLTTGKFILKDTNVNRNLKQKTETTTKNEESH